MDDPTCPVCDDADLVTESELTYQICEACESRVESTPAPDPRPRVPCRGCGHRQLVRTFVNDRSALEAGGVAVTAPKIARSILSNEVLRIVPTTVGYAPLIAYVCRGCGLTELYTDGFADLPFGPQYGAELIDVTSDAGGGPFR